MSRIRSKWTFQERKVHNYLKDKKIKHQMHPKIKGSPDITFKESRKAVFIHGCFWHKCPKCYKEPKSNIEYWLPKIKRNVARDKENIKQLEKAGWKVVIIWEHEIKKNFGKAIRRMLSNY